LQTALHSKIYNHLSQVLSALLSEKPGHFMDTSTLQTYDTNATILCQGYRCAVPGALYRLIEQQFRRGQPTADIGCGSGRDVAWLFQNGFPTVGYDASHAMLAEARAAYSGIDVREASLPHLLAIPDKVYTNVLCSATLMHLHCDDIPIAITNLARILHTGGRLLISYRQSQSPTEREPDGRLFTTFPLDTLIAMFHNAGLDMLTTEQQADATRPGIWWDVLLAELPAT
jgi:ubiquinone/menaquinone biosynthesis C-methylase UbiE